MAVDQLMRLSSFGMQSYVHTGSSKGLCIQRLGAGLGRGHSFKPEARMRLELSHLHIQIKGQQTEVHCREGGVMC